MNEQFGKHRFALKSTNSSAVSEPYQTSEGPRLPVLIVLHQMQSNPGLVGQWFRNNGYPLDVRRPRFGDPLPHSLEHHCGAVIFGGPMSANDSDSFLTKEIEWISVPLEENKPFLGVCLGAQMLVKYLGGEVGPHTASMFECGYYPLRSTEIGRKIVDWPDYVYQWHGEGFSLPEGCDLLAGGGAFENQAIRFGQSAYGVQFHPEITLAMVHRWTVMGARRLGLPGTRPRNDHFGEHRLYGPNVNAWLDRFLYQWVRSSHLPRADENSDK